MEKKVTKKVLLTIDMDIYEKAKAKADKDNRSFNNYLIHVLKTAK